MYTCQNVKLLKISCHNSYGILCILLLQDLVRQQSRNVEINGKHAVEETSLKTSCTSGDCLPAGSC